MSRIFLIISFLILSFIHLPQKQMQIFDATSDNNKGNWQVVNDGVMGGMSEGMIALSEASNVVFEGHVSLENNGGFSSIRYVMPPVKIKGLGVAKLLIKGDGKRYQFRMKEKREDAHSYVAHFETSGDWETISVPFDKFIPQFRGRKLDLPQFSGQMLGEIGFLIANQKAENFQLEIASVILH